VADSEHPGRRKAVAAIDTTFRAIEVSAAEELWLPSLILVYALMDAMAWLDRDPKNEDVAATDFVRWAETYVLQPVTDACAGIDLYGARCGLLHSHTVVSRLMRDGKARPLWYVLPNGEMLVPISSSSLRTATQIGLLDFVSRVREACGAFVAAADGDPRLGESIWARANIYYDRVVPWPTKRSEVM
jgi:hypothetical protein